MEFKLCHSCPYLYLSMKLSIQEYQYLVSEITRKTGLNRMEAVRSLSSHVIRSVVSREVNSVSTSAREPIVASRSWRLFLLRNIHLYT